MLITTILLLFITCNVSAFKLRRLEKHLSSLNKIRTSVKDATRLHQYYSGDDEKTISPKKLITLGVLSIGVFGLGFLSPLKTIVKELGGGEQQQQGKIELKKSSTELNRGALTRLTRREINDKLSKVPIFFVTKGDSVVYVSDSIGYFFVEKVDAENYAKSNNLQVSVTTMDDVFYTLIEKKTKLGSFVTGVAGRADPSATYKLVPSAEQLASVPSDWSDTHGSDDVPLFRAPGLAFSKNEGMEIPLFTRKEDAIASFNRLQESKKATNPAAKLVDVDSVEIQVISIKDLLNRFSSGGFEGRALEIYPSMDAVTAASAMLANAP